MFTVLLSALVFGDELTLLQWAAAFLIFSTLLLNLIFSDVKEDEEEKSEKIEKLENLENYCSNL